MAGALGPAGPQVFPKLSAALAAAAGTGVLVFGEEFSGSDKRKFVVADACEYAREFMARPWRDRRTHEQFLPDRPVNLFFDMESLSMTQAEMDETVRSVKDRVYARFDPYAPCVVLDGSRPGKQSRHVVFHVGIFPDIALLRPLVAALVQGLAHAECVDLGVYGRRGRSLRAPFSTGFGKTCALRQVEPVLDKETPEAFLSGLVQVWGGPESWPPPAVDRFPPPATGLFGAKRARLDDGAEGPTWPAEAVDALAGRVVAWLVRRWPEARVSACRAAGAFGKQTIDITTHGIPCRNKGRPHRSNCIFVCVTLPPLFLLDSEAMKHAPVHLPLHAVCQDAECRPRHCWFIDDVAHLLTT